MLKLFYRFYKMSGNNEFPMLFSSKVPVPDNFPHECFCLSKKSSITAMLIPKKMVVLS